jgi:hypothetical protein
MWWGQSHDEIFQDTGKGVKRELKTRGEKDDLFPKLDECLLPTILMNSFSLFALYILISSLFSAIP